jgi:hypothetical protein
VVELLYTNVTGTAPPPDELALYTGWLDSGGSPQALGVFAAERPLNLENIDFVGLAAHGLVYV